MLVWTPHVCLLSLEARRGLRILRNWSTDGCEWPCGCYDPNPGLLEGPVLLTTDPSVYIPSLYSLILSIGTYLWQGFWNYVYLLVFYIILFNLINRFHSLESFYFLQISYLIVDFEFFSLFCCIMNILMLDQLLDNIRCYGSYLTCLIPLS